MTTKNTRRIKELEGYFGQLLAVAVSQQTSLESLRDEIADVRAEAEDRVTQSELDVAIGDVYDDFDVKLEELQDAKAAPAPHKHDGRCGDLHKVGLIK